ncbi:MAG: T9SS type A sorting domain-containing protein [Bacteroidales bacterium]|nr:T9SS type A sorting domain-containing protein [Bacteroidales bacterium]MCF8344075.1 T9SS type A sorting domain-containing protein [Bacteroidales bacterium]MCF8349735.1 T9SS type A sorting domain-containing protein [Bacteroidales bacterium]MCF8376664.1 T9SS type A sorting domain-containing protein [Bacteroidales bacterium]MCF8402042.1 T9SS type A sorting domain-containing protein [Bacteroidales bacterium]
MKKRILFYSLWFAFSLSASAQSLVMSDDEGDLPMGAIVNVTGEGSGGQIAAHINVTNTAEEQLIVLCRKYYLDVVEGSMNTFCWGGTCYGPNVMISQNADTIQPAETITEFAGDYIPNNTFGISTIMYVWYDMNNPSDSTYAIVNFNTMIEKKLELVGPDNTILEDGATLAVNGEINEQIIAYGIKLVNFTDDIVDVKVRKVIEDTIDGTENAFFWDLEYGVEQYESAAVAMASLKTFYDFRGLYWPYNEEGTSTITYVFFDVLDPDHKVSLTVEYTAEDSQGLGEEDALADFSHAFPNPANNLVNFEYELSHDVQNARIIIRNLLGKTMREIPVSKDYSSVSIDVSDLTEGLYLYSVLIDDRSILTRKLVVKH